MELFGPKALVLRNLTYILDKELFPLMLIEFHPIFFVRPFYHHQVSFEIKNQFLLLSDQYRNHVRGFEPGTNGILSESWFKTRVKGV